MFFSSKTFIIYRGWQEEPTDFLEVIFVFSPQLNILSFKHSQFISELHCKSDQESLMKKVLTKSSLRRHWRYFFLLHSLLFCIGLLFLSSSQQDLGASNGAKAPAKPVKNVPCSQLESLWSSHLNIIYWCLNSVEHLWLPAQKSLSGPGVRCVDIITETHFYA